MSIKTFLQKNKLIITAILSVILTIAIGITIWAVFLRNSGNNSQLTPDYPPQSTDKNQKPIDSDQSQKLPVSLGGGAINVTYSKEAIISLSGSDISLYYANPNASNQNVAISIMIGDVIIAKSGLITPGNMLTELDLMPNVKEILVTGGYDATLLIKAYHPQTNEKAMVDTRAEIIVNVVE